MEAFTSQVTEESVCVKSGGRCDIRGITTLLVLVGVAVEVDVEVDVAIAVEDT